MKSLILLILCSCTIQVVAQWTEVKSYDSYDLLEQEYMDRNDGITYVINYWATWCAPCVKELPYFEELHGKYESGAVRVILVSLDFPNKIDSKLLPYLNKHNIQSEVVLLDDPKSNVWIDKVDPSWQGAIPVTIIYKDGQRKFWDGDFVNYRELEKVFLSIYKS